MKLTIADRNFDVLLVDNVFKRIINIFSKKEIKMIKKSNVTSTYFQNTNIDIVGIDDDDIIIFKYQNAPRNKIININNHKKNTSILKLPKNTSKILKIGDILTFENKSLI